MSQLLVLLVGGFKNSTMRLLLIEF